METRNYYQCLFEMTDIELIDEPVENQSNTQGSGEENQLEVGSALVKPLDLDLQRTDSGVELAPAKPPDPNSLKKNRSRVELTLARPTSSNSSRTRTKEEPCTIQTLERPHHSSYYPRVRSRVGQSTS